MSAITPQETAAEILINQMIVLEQQRRVYQATGAPIEAEYKGRVIDELFRTWQWMCDAEPMPLDGEPPNNFDAWLEQNGATL